jgi:ABC-2 type transport system permease protein
MRAFGKLAFVQTKLYVREPLGVFFTLLFAPLLLILLGFVFGNDPDPMFAGRGYLDVSIPAYAAIIIGIVGLTTVPITAATRREAGVLRRFSATPLRPLTYFLTDILAPFVMTLLGILLLFLLSKLAYDVRFEGNPLSLVAGICLGAFAFFSLGYALAGLVPSARAATAIGNVILIPMMLLSGALIPLEVMPETVRNVSRLLPLTHLVAMLRGLWFGVGWGDLLTEVAVLVGVGIVGTVIVALTFRWE